MALPSDVRQFRNMARVAVAVAALARGLGAQEWNLEMVGRVGGPCDAVYVKGAYAYIGEGPALAILDVSRPSSPVVVGRCTLPRIPASVFVSGGLAYVADRSGGLCILRYVEPLRTAAALPWYLFR